MMMSVGRKKSGKTSGIQSISSLTIIAKRKSGMQRILILTGIFVLLAGLFWPWLAKIPLGRLPGDIIIHKPGLRVFIPITSMVVISIIVSIILWIFKK